MRGGWDPLHAEATRIALSVASAHGFALGGGMALAAHGVVDRPTEDIDLFTDVDGGVAAAVALVEQALRAAGITVVPVTGDAGSPAVDGMDRYLVEWELRRGGRVIRLTLAVLARMHAPVLMELGPVLDLPDLAAWKVAALVGRARERDYIDVAALLETYLPEQLLAMARLVDPELEDEDVPAVGRRLDRLPDAAFAPYRLDGPAVARLRQRFAGWPR